MSTLEERLRDKHDKQDGGHYCMARSEGDTCHIDQEWLLVFIKSEIEQAKHEAREEMRKAINSIDVVFNIEMRPETKEFFEMAVEETKKAMLSHLQSPNDCMCKERWNPGVVHRKDAPCYWPESPKEIT